MCRASSRGGLDIRCRRVQGKSALAPAAWPMEPGNGTGRAGVLLGRYGRMSRPAMERGGRPQWSGAGGCRSKLSQLLGPFISFPRAGTGGACNGWSKRMPGVHGRLRAADRRGSVVLIIIEQCPTCLKPDSDPRLAWDQEGCLKQLSVQNNMLLRHQLQ